MFLDSGPPEPERRDSAPRLGRSMRNFSSLRQKECILPAVTVCYNIGTEDGLLTQVSGADELSVRRISHNEKKKLHRIFSLNHLQTPTAGAHSQSFNPPFYLQFDRKSGDFDSVTMAPKSKKSGDNINSRLALVMKSGKGEIAIRHACEYRDRIILTCFCIQSLWDTSRP